MNRCGRLNDDGTCPELSGINDPFTLGGICMFCRHNCAEICDKYVEVKE
jgi:hypothetical protein